MHFVRVWGSGKSIPGGGVLAIASRFSHAAPLSLAPQNQTEREECFQEKCSRHGGTNLSEDCRPSTVVGGIKLSCSSLRSTVNEKR